MRKKKSNRKKKEKKGRELATPNTNMELISSEPTELLPALSMQRSPESKHRLEPLEFQPIGCDSCPVSNICQHNKPGAACAYEEHLEYQIETAGDLAQLMLEIIRTKIRRLKFSLLQERMQGGILNEQLSQELDTLFDQLDALRVATQEENANKPQSDGTSVIYQVFGDLIQK